MRFRGVLMLLVSLALAGAAAVWANRWMADQLAAAADDAELSRVVAAAAQIPFGTKIDATHLKMIELPPESVPEGAFTDVNETLGLIAVQPIYQGEILIAGRVVETLGGSALAAVVEPGMRAITVRVDDVVGVAGFLLPGNRVDVIATRRGRASESSEAKTLIENLRVLAVDQSTATDKETPVVVRAVTLEATPHQAEEIVQWTQEGKVQLVLRNPLEGADQVAVADLGNEGADTDPAATAMLATVPRTLTVDLIRGTDLSSLTFDKAQ
ncbi:Flp pilus assembly protein CpaB [Thiocapsa sp. KS1]|nr:Flp pilus assembly protein CpaB [Thiocapsa sp. KS1]